MPTTDTLLLGQTLSFSSSPFQDGPDAAQHRPDGAVLIRDGIIQEVGAKTAMVAAHPTAQIVDYGADLLMAGFVDNHVHYPQTRIIASWGKRLIDWLNTYTFPEEMRFGDPDYAHDVADLYMRLALSHGTTSAASYCTIHPESVDAYFMAAQKRGMRMLGGKTAMDRNAPDGLRDTAQSSYDDSKALIQKWDGVDRLGYIITPRFAPTSTPDQLAAMGALWAEHPDCLMQTHMSEQLEEIAWVKELYPSARDYLDTYEAHGLIGRGAIMGHSIHLEDREIARMRDTETAIGHCPTSNTFIGSGLCDVSGLAKAGVKVGLATDTGGGSSFSMLRTMAAAYEVGQLRGASLHPAHLLWLATQGSAQTMLIDDKVGNLVAGMKADIIAVDLSSTEAISGRMQNADDFWEQVFPTIMMGDDRAIRDVWVSGIRGMHKI